MERLFKLVFNNKYIFNIIYSFVHCKDSVLNWRISEIIKNSEHDKFNLLFENHFNGGNDSSDIDNWQYRITPNEQDIIGILGYKELGFKRFLQFYNEFSNKFKTIKKIMKKVSKCGNIETYEFLMKQGYTHNESSEIKRIEYDEMLVESFYDCGNSIDIFNYILQYSNNGNQLNEKQNLKVLKFYTYKKYDQLYSTMVKSISNEKDLLISVGISIDHSDTKLANEIIQHPLFNGITEFCLKILNLVKIKTQFIMTDQCFQVIKVYLDKKQNPLYHIGIFEKLEYQIENANIDSGKTIYGIKFWDINDCDNLIISLSTNSTGERIFYPNSLKQFKYQMQVPNLKFNFFQIKNLYGFAEYLSTHICQLDYIKYFLQLYQDNINNGYIIDYYDCVRIFLYSTFEIAQFIINEKMTLEILNKDKYNYSLYNTAFFGNLDTLKLVESKNPKFIDRMVFHGAVTKGYLNIVKYVLPIVPDFSLSVLHDSSHNNSFNTFSYIINNMNPSKIPKVQNYYQNDKQLKTKFQNLLAEKNIITIPKYQFKNIKLFKQLFKNDFNVIKYNFSTILIECNIQIFHYLLIDNQEKVFSTILNKKYEIIQFIQILARNDIKKLIYYISNNVGNGKYNLLNEYHNDIIRISLSDNYNSISSIINLIINQQNFEQCYYDLTFYSILFKSVPPKHSNYIGSNDFNRFKLPNNQIVPIDQNKFIDYILLSCETITINKFINQVQQFTQSEITILNSIGLKNIDINIQKSTVNNLNNTDSIIDLNKELKF